MKAVWIREFTGPDGIETREVEKCVARDGEALVRVRSAGVNRADLLQARGKYPPPAGVSPNIPGLEFAGEIVELASPSKDLAVGDKVFGITAGEAQAEFLAIDQRMLARVPDELDLASAGAVPEAFITAYDAVFTQSELKHGETLLIHAVASGVGLAAMQLAQAAGARVIGTSRTPEKIDRCLELGLDYGLVVGKDAKFADEVLKATDGRGVDVVLDLVGGSYFPDSVRSLALLGRLSVVGLTGGRESEIDLGGVLSKRATIRGTFLRARTPEEKAEVTEVFKDKVVPLFASRAIRPNIDRVFAIDEAADAYKYLASNESFGKVVIEL